MFFCKHEWMLISETTTKSKFESAVIALDKRITGKTRIPHQLCCGDRKYIQVVTCIKCGKLKRFVEEI